MNATGPNGRKVQDISRIRVVYGDFDNGMPSAFALEPTQVVTSSPGKGQASWNVEGVSAEEHAGVLRRIVADYGADHLARGINRVLRLPGFFHRKNEQPHLVTATSSGKCYTREEILKAFPRVVEEPRETRKVGASAIAAPRIRSALKHVRVHHRGIGIVGLDSSGPAGWRKNPADELTSWKISIRPAVSQCAADRHSSIAAHLSTTKNRLCSVDQRPRPSKQSWLRGPATPTSIFGQFANKAP